MSLPLREHLVGLCGVFWIHGQAPEDDLISIFEAFEKLSTQFPGGSSRACEALLWLGQRTSALASQSSEACDSAHGSLAHFEGPSIVFSIFHFHLLSQSREGKCGRAGDIGGSVTDTQRIFYNCCSVTANLHGCNLELPCAAKCAVADSTIRRLWAAARFDLYGRSCLALFALISCQIAALGIFAMESSVPMLFFSQREPWRERESPRETLHVWLDWSL